ncbi:hypothetical protein FW774_14270 [Pedobacter sp. BS3]|uniref:hypothetical protein n=1 Tax=Pedobacter sp. BS3 TaxID=2567937 RepID=UPI0011ECE1B8|nr:hypothetical protein [Pedobacter sp. BS3]TZF82664.1 hypothetical protein FW774_14270 [Pedobacter sp. BS3]
MKILIVFFLLVVTCFADIRGKSIYHYAPGLSVNTKDRAVKHKKVKFKLGEYSSELDNFRDTAIKALHLMSKVFSSEEFRDSLDKYDFPCSNGWYKPCKTPGNQIINKCDSTDHRVHGNTVYKDLLMEKVVTLNLAIKHPKGKTGSYGWSDACIYKISSYSWWLKNNRRQPLSEEYAIHLAHEYCHIVGYYHSREHSRSNDVAYRVGGIVRNILWRWSHSKENPNS